MAYLSREKRRAAIIETAVELVSRGGLALATVRGIAQELGCSPGQIHHHFASADQLRAEAMREIWRRIEPMLMADLRQMPPRDRLIALLSGNTQPTKHAELNSMKMLINQVWKEAMLAIGMDEGVRQAVAEGVAFWRIAVHDALEDGQTAGQFPRDLDIGNVTTRLLATSLGLDLLIEITVDESVVDRSDFVEALLKRENL